MKEAKDQQAIAEIQETMLNYEKEIGDMMSKKKLSGSSTSISSIGNTVGGRFLNFLKCFSVKKLGVFPILKFGTVSNVGYDNPNFYGRNGSSKYVCPDSICFTLRKI